MFSQERLTEEFRGDTPDIDLRPHTSEAGNPSEQNRPIGSWSQLYLWANVWDTSTKREGQDASATLQWEGRSPTTLIATDSAASMEMMTTATPTCAIPSVYTAAPRLPDPV